MPTREEKIAFIKNQMGSANPEPSRAEKIAFIQSQMGSPAKEPSWLDTNLPMDTTPRGLIQGTLNALPAAGTIAGGAVGTAAEPGLGSLAGAGLGAAGGEALKNLGEKYLLGKEKTRADIYGAPAKGLVEGAAAEAGGQVLGKGIEAAANTRAGQYVVGKAGKVASKIASTFSGVPEKEIETYAKNAEEINQLTKAHDNDSQQMADELRQKMNDTIQAKRKQLNSQISKALETAPKDKVIDVSSVIGKLEKYKASLDPSLDGEAIKDVNQLVDRIKGASPANMKPNELAYVANNEKIAVKDGNITELYNDNAVPKKYEQRLKHQGLTEPTPVTAESAKYTRPGSGDAVFPNSAEDTILELPTGGKGDPKYLANVQTLQKIKSFLQDQAGGAFGSTPVGFQVGKHGARAAKQALNEARAILEASGPKDITAANKALSRLHEIEDVMNKSLLTEGKSASPLYAAGTGGNPASAKILKQLGEETGTDMLGEAEKLAAARTFGKPSLLPVDATGKSLTRMGVAGGLGYLVGHIPGAVVAEGLTSPAAIKAAINGGIAGKNIAQAAFKAAPSAVGRALEMALPKNIDEPSGEPVPPEMDPLRLIKDFPKKDAKTADDKPLRGKAKWSNDGFDKILEHTDDPKEKRMFEENKGALLDDPKIKDLLIVASDLKPGSKAMDKIMSKIQDRMAKEKN